MTEVIQLSSSSSSQSSSSSSCQCQIKEVEREQVSLLALLVALLRKSFQKRKEEEEEEENSNEIISIGWPTDVEHVSHVTFDRFNGFLGLPLELRPLLPTLPPSARFNGFMGWPLEFHPLVPTVPPSASATVFGVSTESMQLSFDSRGNSVPTILLLLQKRLYAQGGLEAEGIFRINAENGQEEYVRDQLNRGMLPDGIDVHVLAGLIKAWFRELPTGVLDSLSSEQVMQSQSEEDYSGLVRLLPPTEAALLDWAINMMADVVQQERLNKMNAHNIAMVFAPNMTQMADPLTALMYAVQVMNFLKTLTEKTLRERGASVVERGNFSNLEYSDDNGQHSPSQQLVNYTCRKNEKVQPSFVSEDPVVEGTSGELENPTDGEAQSDSTSVEGSFEDCKTLTPVNSIRNGEEGKVIDGNKTRYRKRCLTELKSQTSLLDLIRDSGTGQESVFQIAGQTDKKKAFGNLSHINSITERIEAWR